MRLGILSSHPIQYQAPWFRALAREIELQVFFAHRQTAAEQGRAGFGVAFDWDVDLLSGYKYRFLENQSSRPGVNAFFGCDTPEIKQIIREEKYDAFIVCGWFLKSYLQAVRACRSAGVPVLVRGDSQLATPRPRFLAWSKEVVYRIALRQFDGFLSVGKRNREYLRHYGVQAKRIFDAPHFVDNNWFAVRASEARSRRAEIRAGWGAREATLVALFVGKLQPVKRPGDLLAALSRVRECGVDASSVFVGAGQLERQLSAEASTLGSAVRILGFKNQSELPAYYAAADVLVLPSQNETWGLVVNEAMACGLPAIVSDAVGCAPDLIEEGKTGFTFRVGCGDELADRLVELAKMISAGHDFIPALRAKLRRYSVEAAVNGTLTALETLTLKHDRH